METTAGELFAQLELERQEKSAPALVILEQMITANRPMRVKLFSILERLPA